MRRPSNLGIRLMKIDQGNQTQQPALIRVSPKSKGPSYTYATRTETEPIFTLSIGKLNSWLSNDGLSMSRKQGIISNHSQTILGRDHCLNYLVSSGPRIRVSDEQDVSPNHG